MRCKERAMARNYTKTECPLYGTKYCSALNMQGCEKCVVTDANAEGVKRDVDAVLSLLPEGGIFPFFGTDECMLCKGEKKNRAACYGIAEIGNPYPKRERTNMLGMKTKAVVGSILSLQLSCCKDCRRRYGAVANRHITLTLIAAAVMIGLLNFKPVGEAIANVSMALPPILFLGVVLGTWLISRASRKKLMEKYSDMTYLNIFDIPGVDELKKRYWFEMSAGKDISRLIFSKEPLKQGLLTGPVAQEENI